MSIFELNLRLRSSTDKEKHWLLRAGETEWIYVVWEFVLVDTENNNAYLRFSAQ